MNEATTTLTRAAPGEVLRLADLPMSASLLVQAGS